MEARISFSEILPKNAYPSAELSSALKLCGKYVYAYYDDKGSDPTAPFYVGKGTGNRVLQHWAKAVSSAPEANLKKQEIQIRKILADGRLPTVKILAYNLEDTDPDDVYSVVERVIQDAFGIQEVWEKRPGAKDRLKDMPVSTLVQIREDSKSSPVQSLESLIALKGNRKYRGKDRVPKHVLANIAQAPVLLVGLSHTYHSSYSPGQLAEMARMYWVLKNKFKASRFDELNKHTSPVLLAWYTLNQKPTIVGAWRMKQGPFKHHRKSGRDECQVHGPDLALRRDFLGLRLEGTSHQYEGPHLILPSDSEAIDV